MRNNKENIKKIEIITRNNFKFLLVSIILLLFSNLFIYSVDQTNDINFDQTDDMTYDQTSDILEEDIPILEGEELTIIGVQEKSQDIKVITKGEIDKINPSDVIDLLEKKENLTVTRYGAYGNQSTLGIRGLGGKRIAILIDGVPVNSVQSGDFDLSKLNVSNIEKIEIIKGSSDTKYNVSGAIGGIINIITIKKNKPGLKFKSSVSNLFYYPDFYIPKKKYENEDRVFSKWYDFFDTQHGTLGFGIGNEIIYWNLNWAGTRAFNHFIYKDDSCVKRRLTDNEVYDTSTSSYLTINLPQYMKLIFSGDYYYGYKYMPGPINSVITGKQIDNMARGSILFDADKVGSDRIDTELIVSNNFSNKDWFQDIEEENIKATSEHTLNTINIINRWGFFVTGLLTIRIGGDFSYTYLDSTDLKIINSFNGGGWATFEYSINNVVQIIPSVKLVYYKKYPVAIPKLGFVFNVGENWTIKNNFFRAYRMPSLDDLYWPKEDRYEGNPDLKNEDGLGGDIILSYYKEKILSAESSFYMTYLYDAIYWQSGSGGKWMPENIGKSFYVGIDNTIKSDFSKYVKLILNYSFLLSYYLSDEVSVEDDKRMPYNPIHMIGLGAEFNWNSGQINLMAKYTSERYTTTSNVTELKPYFLFDINFSQDIKWFTVFASVKNAVNSLYFLQDNYPMPGGSVTIGLKVKYEYNFKKKDNNN